MVFRDGLEGVAVAWIAVLSWVLAGPSAAGSASFRVDNKVFVNNEKEPRSRSTTIFHEGLVYDFLDKPAEITVFDLKHRRFVLLDPARRAKAELGTEELLALCDKLRTWAKRQSDPFLQFMADPRFEDEFDEAAGELVFKSQWMTYRVAPTPAENEGVGQQYREFSDWSTRLNARLNPGSKLPFPRLEVNQFLEKRHELPREVKLEIQPKKGIAFQKHVARSEHSFTTRLSQADQDRIGQTAQFMAIFQPVDFDQYQKSMGR